MNVVLKILSYLCKIDLLLLRSRHLLRITLVSKTCYRVWLTYLKYFNLEKSTPECKNFKVFLNSITDFKLTSTTFKEIKRMLKVEVFMKHRTSVSK